MPLKLKMTVYRMSLFTFLFFNEISYNVNIKKNFFLKKNNSYHFDIFSKNNSLFKYLKKLKKGNIFRVYLNINTFF